MKHPIRRRLMYFGFQGLQTLGQALPLRVSRALGRWVGVLAYAVLGAQRRLALRHLAYALGDSLSPSQRRQVARSVFMNLGQNVMEWLKIPKLSMTQIQQMITVEGIEHVKAALVEGNGVIMVGPHFGNWEFVPILLRGQGFEGGILARRLRYPEYESFLISLRGGKGVPTFVRGSLKDVAKTLRANQLIGLLPDQDIDSLEGVFVEFFGHPARTPVGPAALSILTGAPILPCFMIREGERFRFVVEAPLRAPQGMDRVQAMTALTQAWSRVFERYIRRYPAQWTWMHRRWKTQPPVASAGALAAGSAPQAGHPSDDRQQPPIERRSTVQPVLTVLLWAACGMLGAGLAGCAKSAQPKAIETKAATVPAAGDAAAPDQPTQSMSEFTLTGYKPEGGKSWDLKGEGANVEGNIVTIQHPDAVGYDVARTAYLTARVAHVDQTTRHVRLEHDVTIHTTDGLWLTSPRLNWIPDQNQMATDEPVRIETDHMLLRGRGATGFTQLKQATILRDIELVLNPTDHDVPATGRKQVIITCDGPLAFDYEHSVATFETNVHVQDPNGDLYSDKLTAYLDQATHTIRYAEASGHVRIHQEQNTALSERAVYEPAIGKITMVGKPSLLVYPSQDGQGSQLSFGGLAGATKPAARAAQPSSTTSTP